MTQYSSINSIDDLTDLEVLAVVQKLKEDPVMTEMLGIAWAIGIVTNRPLLLDHTESAPLLYARYQELCTFSSS